MTAGQPTAAWTTRDLVGALARAGWGPDLDGRAGQGMRSVLRALVDLTGYQSGTATLTAGQVADATGLSSRWVRHCLHRLEALGLVRWVRGYILEGRPTPGTLTLVKRSLAALVRSLRSRRWLDPRRAQRADATRERIAGLRQATVYPKKRFPLSNRPELGSTLPPLQGEYLTRAAVGQALERNGRMPECIHGDPYGPGHCPACRRLSTTTHATRPLAALWTDPTPADPAAVASWADKARRALRPTATQPTLTD